MSSHLNQLVHIVDENKVHKIAKCLRYNNLTKLYTIKYERNEYMSKELLSKLPSNPIQISLPFSDTEHTTWLDLDMDVFCIACNRRDLTDLYTCNSDHHKYQTVSFHSSCLQSYKEKISKSDKNTTLDIPSHLNADTWICPQHTKQSSPSNKRSFEDMNNEILSETNKNENELKFKRRRITDDVYTAKQRLIKENSGWLKIANGKSYVYPSHLICEWCASEQRKDCDGKRPCNNCYHHSYQYAIHRQNIQKSDIKESDAFELQVHNSAKELCHNKNPSLDDISNDAMLKLWTKATNFEHFQHLMEINDDLQSVKNSKNINIDTNVVVVEQEIKDSQKMIKVNYKYEEPQYISSIPMFAKYECEQCKKQFSDRHRYTMHKSLAHESQTMSVNAYDSHWNILPRFQAFNNFAFECPYSGCLRGSDLESDIEQHILRHHDISDPTKPAKFHEKCIMKAVEVNGGSTLVFHKKYEDFRIQPLTNEEKDRLESALSTSKDVYDVAKAKTNLSLIGKSKKSNIMKTFVDSILDGTLVMPDNISDDNNFDFGFLNAHQSSDEDVGDVGNDDESEDERDTYFM